jgi:ATP-dependent Clp protease ATP-binding subunit ClpB
MDVLVSAKLLARLNTLEDFLRSNILGQAEPLSEIASLLQRSLCGLRLPGRPVASMLMLGPTGVGKTETALLFTQHLFGSEEKLVRFDMSEFMNQSALNILVGNRVGERGLFGHYYDRSGGSGTLLFDELEKAHPLVMDIFLQILSAGRFTLASGETLDLSNYVVVATTNIGSRVLMESRSTDRETLVRRTLQAGTSELRPETYARFDLHAVFNKLYYEVLKDIAAVHLAKILGLINQQGHSVIVGPGVLEYIQREGYSEKFGARPMQNSAMRTIGDVIARGMLSDSGRPMRGTISYDSRSNKCSLTKCSRCEVEPPNKATVALAEWVRKEEVSR